MAANVRTEMRIPTRSAPRPPVNSTAQRNVIWNSTNNVYGSTLTQQSIQKKKPPPRPPPPKFNQNYSQVQKDKSKKPARPTELLSNLFGRKRNEHINTIQLNSQVQNAISQSEHTNGSVCLIDFSPPGSPTFTTRSSSDGVSIDSFGSDGNSNPSVFTSSGNTSQTESAFEDDFDVFGLSTKKTPKNDPWQINSISDPFGPIEVSNHNSFEPVKSIGDAQFFAFNTNNHVNNQMSFTQTCSKTTQLPTIIRAKLSKPPAPKTIQKKMEKKINCDTETGTNCFNKTVIPFTKPITLDLTNSWSNDTKDSPSPPMPTIPPPAPPPEYLTEINNDHSTTSEEPYGVALYDFPVTHADDLPFKEGDIIYLIRKVNDDWMEGRTGNRQGIFPINFIDIKVPLPGVPDNVVIAVYPFQGETIEDLTFSEGEKITVLSRISQDWLYGECKGRKGQFPANYVNRIPFLHQNYTYKENHI
ncbi:SH3 domain-containing lethal (3) 05822 isoform X2 [Megachile rotundata]|uniref:SH3 domain-containing lethal (3) 05822 isoform X2 n=2 Tax=Megachile rotundata TaxID=143995 RepID=UPI003FD10AC5